MTKVYALTAATLVFAVALPTTGGQAPGGPETVVVHNGPITLHALLWRPQGGGPFPAILLNKGSSRTREELQRLEQVEQIVQSIREFGFVNPVLVGPLSADSRRGHARCRCDWPGRVFAHQPPSSAKVF